MWNRVHLMRYLWEVSRQLPGSWKEKKRILSRMQRSIRDYVSEGENPSYEKIIERFGKPNQIAATFLGEMETEELLRNMKASGRVVQIVAITAILIIAMWAGVVSIALVNELIESDGYGTMTIIDNSSGETIYQEFCQ